MNVKSIALRISTITSFSDPSEMEIACVPYLKLYPISDNSTPAFQSPTSPSGQWQPPPPPHSSPFPTRPARPPAQNQQVIDSYLVASSPEVLERLLLSSERDALANPALYTAPATAENTITVWDLVSPPVARRMAGGRGPGSLPGSAHSTLRAQRRNRRAVFKEAFSASQAGREKRRCFVQFTSFEL